MSKTVLFSALLPIAAVLIFLRIKKDVPFHAACTALLLNPMKPLRFVMLVVPVLAIALWFWLGNANPAPKPHAGAQSKPEERRTVSGSSAKSGKGVGNRSGTDRDYEQERREIDARRAKNFEEMAKLAANFDPQLTIDGVDRVMRSREPRYRELFNAWNIDDAMASQVLGILRGKKIQRQHETLRQMREKTHEVGDMTDQAKVKASRDKDRRNEKDIELEAELQLQPILGNERYLQLMELDKRLLNEAVIKATKD